MKAFSAHKPAFPLSRPIDETLPNIGLTKREYFAAMAMQGMVKDMVWQDSITGEIHSVDYVSKVAILIADELLKQLES